MKSKATNSLFPAVPTTPEGRAGMRAYCERAKGARLAEEIAISRAVMSSLPRVLADLERALDRIAKAPHDKDCEALRRENCGLIPEAPCRFVGPSGMRYEYCCIHARADCNCWKSEARKR